MKNRIKQYLLAASMCVGLTACSDFFEPIPGVQFGLDETFASKQRTEEYLNNVYSYVREVTDAIHPNTYGGIFTEASLDGANRWNKTYAEWTNGSFNSASAQASEYFSKYYQAIAKASTFIQNVDKCTEAAASTRGKPGTYGCRHLYGTQGKAVPLLGKSAFQRKYGSGVSQE